jgi:hypothetical protein
LVAIIAESSSAPAADRSSEQKIELAASSEFAALALLER